MLPDKLHLLELLPDNYGNISVEGLRGRRQPEVPLCVNE